MKILFLFFFKSVPFLLYLLGLLEIQSILTKEMKINTSSNCDKITEMMGTNIENNKILLIWVESCNGTPEIIAKEYSQKGVIKRNETELSFNLHESIFFRKIVSLEKGGFAIFIGTSDANSHNIWANIFESDLTQKKFDIVLTKIERQGTQSQQKPLIHKLSNGSYLVIFVIIQIMPFQSTRVVSIYARLFNADFILLSEKFPLNEEKFINDAYYVNIVNTANDGFALIWSRQINQSPQMDVIVRNFDNSINPKTNELIIPNTDNLWAISAAQLPNGNFILIFSKEDGACGKIFTPQASPVGNEFKMQDDAYKIKINSLSNSGKFVATWDSGKDLFGALYGENGNLIKEGFKINSSTSCNMFDQIILELDDGGFFVAFNSMQDSISQVKGIFGQLFSGKGLKLDPEPLLCNSTFIDFPVNSTTVINLVQTVKTSKIKLHSLPLFGKLIDVNNQTEAEIHKDYSLTGLKYVNEIFSKYDYFNFSSVDGFNEGSECQANLLMYEQIPESKNITFSVHRHENSVIEFMQFISDKEEEPKELFINFISLPICGKVFSNGEEVSQFDLGFGFKATNIFTYKSQDCLINTMEDFSYSAVNKFNKSSIHSHIQINILKPFPVSEAFNLYVDKEKDKIVNFTSHVSDELTDKRKLKVVFLKAPICGGKLYDIESKKEIVLSQPYIAMQGFLYKISVCDKNQDLFTFSILNEDLLQSPETEVKVLLKQPPNVKEISLAVVEKGKICFKFDKYKVNDYEDPFELLSITFTQAPFQGEIFDTKNDLIYLNHKYSILTEFCYLNQKRINDNSEDLFFYTAINSFELESRETKINMQINPNVKWWATPMSILAFIFSGCAAIGTFIFTLCKCKAKGFCCWKKKKNIQVQDVGNDLDKDNLLEENLS